MFVCYLDDSDDTQSSVSTLAGYVAEFDRWEAYETHAKGVYEFYGVDVLSAKEMHNGKGPFKGWSWAKKWSFVDTLLEGIALTWGVGLSVSKSSFQSLKQQGIVDANMSKLGLAMSAILHSLVRGNPLSGHIQAQKLSCVVESGHRNNGDIERCFHMVKKDPLFNDYLGTLAFNSKTDSRAIHLADLLAFYARRYHSLQIAHGQQFALRPSKELCKLQRRVPHLLNIAAGDTARRVPATSGDAVWWPVPIKMKPDQN